MWGKKVLVVGASGDIGQAITRALHEAGGQVLMTGRSLKSLLQIMVPRAGGRLVPLAADLTSAVDIDRLALELRVRQPLNAIVVCAGTYSRSTDPEMLRRQMEVNLIGPYALIRAIMPLLIDSAGDVVFINSSQALRASAEVGQYAATRHALKAIADSLRDEVNEQGVRVASIYLGRTAGERQREIATIEGRPYAPGHLIQPDDVASLVRHILQLPRTAEITDVSMRPRKKA
jgi:NADP-dependent 3-hydroxy acid dehydrogenase YdfG